MTRVGGQSGLTGVSFTNVGVDRPGIEVGFSVKGITTGMEGGFFKCGTNYKSLTGSLVGTTTLLGFAE